MKTLDEWYDSITATLTDKGRDRYYTAFCPICGATDTATSIGSEAGRPAAKGKILSHIQKEHANLVAAKNPEAPSAS
jgi:allophanate hydrolase subunit 2